jgi:hypothetical protein
MSKRCRVVLGAAVGPQVVFTLTASDQAVVRTHEVAFTGKDAQGRRRTATIALEIAE